MRSRLRLDIMVSNSNKRSRVNRWYSITTRQDGKLIHAASFTPMFDEGPSLRLQLQEIRVAQVADYAAYKIAYNEE